MKYSIPLALLVVVRTFAKGVNAEFTVIPRSSIFSHFVISLVLSDDQEVLLLIEDGFYLRLMEDRID